MWWGNTYIVVRSTLTGLVVLPRDSNLFGWLLVVAGVLSLVWGGYTTIIRATLGFGSLFSVTVATLLSWVLLLAGVPLVWFGIRRVDDSRQAVIVAAVAFLVLFACAFVYSWFASRGSSNGFSFEFYVQDSSGNVVKMRPRSAFGSLAIIAKDGYNLGSSFALLYDCHVVVTGADYGAPSSLTFTSDVEIWQLDSSWNRVGSTAVASTGSYTVPPATVLTYMPGGWTQTGTGKYEADVAKTTSTKLTCGTVSEAAFVSYGSHLGFTGKVYGTVSAGTQTVNSNTIVSPLLKARRESLAAIITVGWSGRIYEHGLSFFGYR